MTPPIWLDTTDRVAMAWTEGASHRDSAAVTERCSSLVPSQSVTVSGDRSKHESGPWLVMEIRPIQPGF
jgi:hypothetical protein